MNDAYRKLRNRWEAAIAAYHQSDSVANYEAEEIAWDALINYVETHGLNYTDLDPRS